MMMMMMMSKVTNIEVDVRQIVVIDVDIDVVDDATPQRDATAAVATHIPAMIAADDVSDLLQLALVDVNANLMSMTMWMMMVVAMMMLSKCHGCSSCRQCACRSVYVQPASKMWLVF